MSNSNLVDYTKISPNSTNPRKDKIRKITIHHVAGNLTVEQIGNVFAPKSRKASSNYGIDSSGRVGMYVEEKNRAWTSSNANNDNQAVTIEVANDKLGPKWTVSDKALSKLVELCVDICKRNGIKELVDTGDAKGNLTRHNMFAATLCPGPYLQSKFPYIVKEVNKQLNANPKQVELYRVRKSWPDSKSQLGAFSNLQNAIDLATKNKGYKVFDSIGKQVYPQTVNEPKKENTSFKVKVTASGLNVRQEPNTKSKINTTIRDKGTYTIIETKGNWGKLKSGAGWIHLDYTQRL